MMNRKILGLLFVAAIFATLLASVDAQRGRIMKRDGRREPEDEGRRNKDEENSIETTKNKDDEKETDYNAKKESEGTKETKKGENIQDQNEGGKTADEKLKGQKIMKRSYRPPLRK